MSAPLVFLDTETTGLSLDDDIWELAAIRREPDGSEQTLHLFIEHDDRKCSQLPESFRKDHERRYDTKQEIATWLAVERITALLHGPTCGLPKPHIVGAVPNFDTERLLSLIRRHRYTPDLPWHYHLIDVENLAVGWIAGQGTAVAPPWKSDDLAAYLGVTITEEERHTALGDARWAQRIYDAVMNGGAS